MEILNAYSGNGHPSATFYEHKRYTNFIDLDSNYRLLGEVFRVDDLLDFSNDDIAAPIGNSLNSSVTEAKTNIEEPPTEGCRAPVVPKEKVEEEALELIDIPCDDAELEWLSNFVEDSSSIDEAPKLSGNSFPFKGTKEFVTRDSGEEVQCESPPSGLESSSASGGWKNQFPDLSSVPARARSKRSRTGSKVWSSDILTTPSSSTTSGCSEPVSMLDDTSATPLHCFTATCSSSFSGESSYDMQDTFELPPAKKPKGSKKKQENSQLQKCLHCGSQKTPQWRTGPLGPKTLCNACGVRFKSGRLFPEYRPAASPTFLPQVHSNSHKKVLEMRRQKEDV